MAALHLIADVNQHITNLHLCEKANMYTRGSHSLSLTTFSWWSLDSGINYHLCNGWSIHVCNSLDQETESAVLNVFKDHQFKLKSFKSKFGGLWTIFHNSCIAFPWNLNTLTFAQTDLQCFEKGELTIFPAKYSLSTYNLKSDLIMHDCEWWSW